VLSNRNTSQLAGRQFRLPPRFAAALALIVGLTMLAACASDAATVDVGEGADSAETASDVANDDVANDTASDAEVTDSAEVERPEPPTDIEVAEFDDRKKPVVPFDGETMTELGIEDVIVGDGAEAVDGSFVSVHYVGVLNSSGEQFDASWDRGQAFQFGLGGGSVIVGWDEGVLGMREGGRRILRIPAAKAYGDGGSGIITPGSDLVFTVDLASVVQPADPADEPELTAPDELSGELEIEDLVEGTGAGAVAGDTIEIHFTSILASTGQRFVSTWDQGGLPAQFVVGEDNGLDGFDQALVGAMVGGARKVTIPPDLAFGADGLPGQVGPDETIVLQFDVVSIAPAAEQ